MKEALEAWIKTELQDYRYSTSIGSYIDDHLWGNKVLYSPVGELTLETRVGGEDQGSQYYIVVKLTDHYSNVTYYKVEGYYSSWDGIDWGMYGDGLVQVEPAQVYVTDWREVKG